MADLFFFVSFLVCVGLLIRILWQAIRGNWTACGTTTELLAGFVAAYATVLVALALLLPRRELAPGERKCFDDWCVAVDKLELQPSPSPLCPGAPAPVWVASIQVSSVARRIHQRAPDASPELEDDRGNRYGPCQSRGEHDIHDLLGPGESFPVSVAFAVPPDAHPAGLIVWHGKFPGLIIAGDDQSWLHKPTLFRAKSALLGGTPP